MVHTALRSLNSRIDAPTEHTAWIGIDGRSGFAVSPSPVTTPSGGSTHQLGGSGCSVRQGIERGLYRIDGGL